MVECSQWHNTMHLAYVTGASAYVYYQKITEAEMTILAKQERSWGEKGIMY